MLCDIPQLPASPGQMERSQRGGRDEGAKRFFRLRFVFVLLGFLFFSLCLFILVGLIFFLIFVCRNCFRKEERIWRDREVNGIGVHDVKLPKTQ